MKNISILGSSGSIGTQALDVIRRYPDIFNVVGLSVNGSIDVLLQQIEEFQPKVVSVGSEKDCQQLSKLLDIPVYHGMNGLNIVSTLEEADIVLNALVGSVGIEPTYNAINAGKVIALANKETLVAAGDIIMNEARKNKVSILPVDSEHSALFQSMLCGRQDEISHITLTCSGGPFYGMTREQLQHVTAKDALAHPTWEMGGKISIDSATLMNKGFEVIEAHQLFGIPYSNIDVVIHPESIVHSMVEYVDGSVIAQLATHDMRIPILYALSYPERLPLDIPKLDLAAIGKLTFSKPDTNTFRCLSYAYEAGGQNGSSPCVLNAANEIAVEHFLKGNINFLDIPDIIRHKLNNHVHVPTLDIRNLLYFDNLMRERTTEYIHRKYLKE